MCIKTRTLGLHAGVLLRDQKVKLYAEFYDCDIIVASPLGLRLVTGTFRFTDAGATVAFWCPFG